MSDKEVLEACVQRAINNGWEGVNGIIDAESYLDNLLPVIIYNHEFAKALFGEEEVRIKTDMGYMSAFGGVKLTSVKMPAWMNYLQQMVISPDPIGYLREWAGKK